MRIDATTVVQPVYTPAIVNVYSKTPVADDKSIAAFNADPLGPAYSVSISPEGREAYEASVRDGAPEAAETAGTANISDASAPKANKSSGTTRGDASGFFDSVYKVSISEEGRKLYEASISGGPRVIISESRATAVDSGATPPGGSTALVDGGAMLPGGGATPPNGGATPPGGGATPSGSVTNGISGVSGQIECETCKNRKYVDESGDSSVSFQTPTRISPEAAPALVAAHEGQHVSNERAKAAGEGRRIVSQSVSIETSICPECGRVYVSGGETRTVSVSESE